MYTYLFYDAGKIVLDGKWKLDILTEFTEKAYADLNGDDEKAVSSVLELMACAYNNNFNGIRL